MQIVKNIAQGLNNSVVVYDLYYGGLTSLDSKHLTGFTYQLTKNAKRKK